MIDHRRATATILARKDFGVPCPNLTAPLQTPFDQSLMTGRRKSKSTPTSKPTSRYRWWRILAICGILVFGFAWFWSTRLEPRWILHDAARVFEQDPRKSAALLEAAVAQSGGSFPEAELLWTRALLRLGQRAEALGCFSMIEDPDQLDADDLLQLSAEARQSGELLLAAFALEAIPARSDRFLEASQQLQQLRFDQGRFMDVLALGKRIVEESPASASPHLLMAQAHEQLGDPLTALESYRLVLKQSQSLTPDEYAMALRRAVRIALQTGEFADARRWSAELKEHAKPTGDDRLAEAELLRLTGEADQAWGLVNELAEQEPSNPAVLELRGTLAMERSEEVTAERDFREILRKQPWNKGAHYKLAQILQRTGRGTDAERHFAENRRLTDISVRVLALQQRVESDAAQERARLQELAELYSELGQPRLAEQMRQRLP